LKTNQFSARPQVFDCKVWQCEAPEPCNFVLGFPWLAKHDSIAASENTMRPKKHGASAEGDLFWARLDQIINMKHELVQLAGKIDWVWIDGEMAPL
jgi:hypothetical protein